MLSRWWAAMPTLTALSSLVQPAASTPYEFFPINSQLPPVARISQPFNFTFSASTFISSSGTPVTYTLSNAPSWLSIDSASRRIYGTPREGDVPSGDVVGVGLQLVAKDRESSVTAVSTLVVSRQPVPEVKVSLDQQIAGLGPFSTPSSLLMQPSKDFRFSFDAGTFGLDGGSSALYHYAVSADSTPLPAWIQFNAKNLSFFGTTPRFETLIQPPQTFSVQVVASDVAGFSAISIAFSLVVGIHELSADTPVIPLDVTLGTLFEYKELPSIVKLDGKPISSASLQSVTATGLPSWLNFDSTTWQLSGMPDAKATSSNVTITFVDAFEDQLNVTASLRVKTATTSATSSTAAPSSTSSPSPTNAPATPNDSNPSFNGVLLFVLLPVLILCIILTVLIFYCRGKRRRPDNVQIMEKGANSSREGLGKEPRDTRDDLEHNMRQVPSEVGSKTATVPPLFANSVHSWQASVQAGSDEPDAEAAQPSPAPKTPPKRTLSTKLSVLWKRASPLKLLDAYGGKNSLSPEVAESNNPSVLTLVACDEPRPLPPQQRPQTAATIGTATTTDSSEPVPETATVIHVPGGPTERRRPTRDVAVTDAPAGSLADWPLPRPLHTPRNGERAIAVRIKRRATTPPEASAKADSQTRHVNSFHARMRRLSPATLGPGPGPIHPVPRFPSKRSSRRQGWAGSPPAPPQHQTRGQARARNQNGSHARRQQQQQQQPRPHLRDDRDGRRRLSQIREQQTLDNFRTMMAASPPPPRPLPQIPARHPLRAQSGAAQNAVIGANESRRLHKAPSRSSSHRYSDH